MTTITIRIPSRGAQVVSGHLGYGIDILAEVRLDLLAGCLNAMEHNDTDPGERRMNADQCRDALLREVLHSWTTRELIGARIPGVLELADLLHECRETLSKFRPVEFLLKSGPLDTEAAFAQCVEKIREQSAQLAGAAAMQDMMTREAFEFKAQVATLTRERDEARARIEEWESFRSGFENLSYHSEGMGCGIEDRGITDRYVACEHGWDCAMERVAEWIPEVITTPTPGAQP